MTLTPREYAFWPDDENAKWGLVFCDDEQGNHVTLRGDVELVRMLRDAGPEARRNLEVGGEWERRDGWPDEW